MNDSDARSVWVAFYWDFSALLIFFDELQAHRHARDAHMEVRNVPTGVDIREFLTRRGE